MDVVMPGAHLHLDAVGGVAGDMFAAAMVDLWPELMAGLEPLLRSAGLADDVVIGVVDHHDEVFRGRRFVVDDPRERARRRGPGSFVFQRQHAQHAGHAHVPFKGILAGIAGSTLSDGAKARATDIFTRLAFAEGGVHGLPLDDVAFHEVGSQDSVADIVTAAIFLDRLEARYGPLTASVSSLPLGSGRVMTAHGELPVPAPATLALMQGLLVHDDGRAGERVTPTGAAIVKHLVGDAVSPRQPGVLAGMGVGFGTRTFVGLSNIVRVTLSVAPASSSSSSSSSSTTALAAAWPWQRRPLQVLACEIDDMSAEELGHAAEQLRATDGVTDVILEPVFMKKGRPGTRVQVLCAPAATDAVVAAVFVHTSTLGVRVLMAERRELTRHDEVSASGLRRKRARRPGNDSTVKVEHDVVEGDSLQARRRHRQHGEEQDG
jgi:uncharacterized protein (TIGR00299 family) protein